MKNGKFILVTGFYGASKTTLVQAALDAIQNLDYLKTTTTRPPRPEEIRHGSLEYEFVSPEQYAARRSASQNWDHTFLQDHSYGADVDEANRKLGAGTSLICCIAPDKRTIAEMSAAYAARPVIIWIDTDLQIANERLFNSGNERRIARIEHHLQSEANAAEIRQLCSLVFKPTANLAAGKEGFTVLVRQVQGNE